MYRGGGFGRFSVWLDYLASLRKYVGDAYGKYRTSLTLSIEWQKNIGFRWSKKSSKAQGMKKPPNLIDIYVGQRVRARRKELRMSQTVLGQLLGVTFQQVQKYESGINRIASGSLHKVARALKVPLAYFFEGFTDKTSPDFPLEFIKQDNDNIMILEALNKIRNPVLKDQIIQLILEMAKKEDLSAQHVL